MITKETNLYEFSELSERAQEKVLQEFCDINVDYDDWTDVSYYEEQLQELGFEDSKVHYTGFSSQGDGACFECRNVDILLWLEKSGKEKDFPLTYSELKFGENDLEVFGSFYHSGHYYHQNCMYLRFDFNCYYDEDKLLYDHLEKESEKLEGVLLDFARDKAQDIYRSLEKEFDYLTSREQIIETIEANEYLFDEFGRLEMA